MDFMPLSMSQIMGVYLVHHQLVKHNKKSFKYKALQGQAMERAGAVEVDVDIVKDEPSRVRITEGAITVFRSELVM